MNNGIERREFLCRSLGGAAACMAAGPLYAGPIHLPGAERAASKIVSPGCRRSRVKVARIYLGLPRAHYPNPALDLQAEVRAYRERFEEQKADLADVDFLVDEMVGSPEQVAPFREKIAQADGVLAIHLTLGTLPAMKEILALGRPTTIFSAPYSGHEWFYLSELGRQDLGKHMECLLTTDYAQLSQAIRPFRAIHHLREAKILNVASWPPGEYGAEVKKKFGTEIMQVSRDRMLKFYDAVGDGDANAEAQRWTRNAVQVVEPSAEDIFKSSKLALAFEKLMDEEDATVIGVDCYGSMYHQLPAFPCIGFTRLNDMGLGGICQSDLPCAMVHILFQGLCGRPGFVCNPTFDFATGSATLIHCLGTTKMDGPAGPSAPYKLRSIMEREEGAVPEVQMRTGERVTAAIFDATSSVRYFTGQIVGVPLTDRGCRTKITVKLDGDAETLWRNWTAGIHRVACYGDISKELARFCRFLDLKLVNEAV